MAPQVQLNPQWGASAGSNASASSFPFDKDVSPAAGIRESLGRAGSPLA